MDYPRRVRKLRKRTPEDNGAGDRGELRLAEFSAQRDAEMPSPVPVSDEPVFACDGREWRLERGRLH